MKLAGNKLPAVDDPVNRLSSNSLLPTGTDGLPGDHCDRRIEQVLRRGFEASANAIKASVASSLFVRVANKWVTELLEESDAPNDIKEVLRKIKLATAYMADGLLDSLQMVARSMAASVTAHRNTWIRNWDADSMAQNKVVSVPFTGVNLFGDGLDRYLIEDKGKKRVLPSKGSEFRNKRRFQFNDNQYRV